MPTHPLYAVIDLGSNSFHMLITRLVADSVQVVDKVKRKVRLASGLNTNNELNDEAMKRGLECLSFFAERLQDIPLNNIRIVATATLRLATNADIFIAQANAILNHKIRVLSGEEEAQYIFLGVAHTSYCNRKRLVLDIGGASTEIIAGDGFIAEQAVSLNMGCVTFEQQFFSDGLINEVNFSAAINQAKNTLSQALPQFIHFPWQVVLGGSGTMQALAEILMHHNKPAFINLDFLLNVKSQLLECQTLSHLKIAGLRSERKPAFVSGVAILIALYESLNIQQLQLSAGAIREGLLYEMLPDMRKISIRIRTVKSLSERFHIDKAHGERVSAQAEHMFKQVQKNWALTQDNSFELLKVACTLHEIGLLLDFKRHQQHGEYILKNSDMPGFDQADKQFLIALVLHYKSDIHLDILKNQCATSFKNALHIMIILRIAVILCRRRKDDVLPAYQFDVKGHNIMLCLPQQWLNSHPLIADELRQEIEHLKGINFTLVVHS